MAILSRARPARSGIAEGFDRGAARLNAARLAAVSGEILSDENAAVVAALVAQGFKQEEAVALVAKSKKTREQLAKEAAETAKDFVASEANLLGVKKLEEIGYTEAEAKRLIAQGRDVQELIAKFSSFSSKQLSKEAIKVFEDNGFSKAEAQALAATGGDPEKLLELLKDEKFRKDFFGTIDSKLKSYGIDFQDRVGKGLGLTDKDLKMAGNAIKVVESAYKIYSGISSAISAYSSASYFAGRWSEDAMSDASLADLIQTLNELGQLNEADRSKRQKQLTEGINAATDGVAAVASMFGPIGMVVAAVVVAVERVWMSISPPQVAETGNAGVWQGGATGFASDLWSTWRIVPPSFNTRFYTLESYSATNEITLQWLKDSDRERPWQRAFVEAMKNALVTDLSPAGKKTNAPADDLAMLGWFPFSFQDWAGGTNFPGNRHWYGPDHGTILNDNSESIKDRTRVSGGSRNARVAGEKVPDGYWNLDLYPIVGSGFYADLPTEMTVGSSGLGIKRSSAYGGIADGNYSEKSLASIVVANRAATLQARNQNAVSESRLFQDNFMDNVWNEGAYLLPRGEEIQRFICDRIATTIAILLAVQHQCPAEPLVETAIGSSRKCIEVYGWQPKNAAKRLRDTFLATVDKAKKTPKFGSLPVSTVKAGKLSLIKRS